MQAEEAGKIHALALGYPGRGDDALGGADGLIELEGQAGENKGQALVKAQGVEIAAGRVEVAEGHLLHVDQQLGGADGQRRVGVVPAGGQRFLIDHVEYPYYVPWPSHGFFSVFIVTEGREKIKPCRPNFHFRYI